MRLSPPALNVIDSRGHDDRPPLVFDEVDTDKSSDSPALAHGSYYSFCLHSSFGTCCKTSPRKYSALYCLPPEQLIHVHRVVSSHSKCSDTYLGSQLTEMTREARA